MIDQTFGIVWTSGVVNVTWNVISFSLQKRYMNSRKFAQCQDRRSLSILIFDISQP